MDDLLKKETELLCDDPDFQYVVELQTATKVCFGSRIVRDTNPVGKGLAPHQRRLIPEQFPNIGPGCYNIGGGIGDLKLSSKKATTEGVQVIPNRFEDTFKSFTPGPGRYDLTINWGAIKQSPAPFNTSSYDKKIQGSTPGPTDLRKIWKCRRTRVMSNFGKPKMIDAVETICVPKPVDRCYKCTLLCEGDYWHKDYTVYLCHPCRQQEKYVQELFNHKELNDFKKIRNCSFMHNHEGTKAATWILPPNKVKKKIRLENYLDMYLSCDGR